MYSARNPTKNVSVIILEGKEIFYFLNISMTRSGGDTEINGYKNCN